MKAKLLARLSTFSRSYSSVPLMLLLVAGISFGLLLPRLGYYFDDWETILTLKVFGLAKMWDYFQGTRPLASWTYFVFTPLVGAWTLGWQLLSLGLRWLTVVTMWWVFCQVWPERKFAVTAAAVLFMVYPMFIEQPIAVSYHQHWTAYWLYFISLALMLRAVTRSDRSPGPSAARYWLWTLLACAASALHLAVLEYFVGVELLRPLVLFYLPCWRELPLRRRLAQATKAWLPYLGFTLLFVAARIAYSFRLLADVNRPKFLLDLLHSPALAIGQLWPIASKDTLYAFVTAWYKALPLTFFEARRSLLVLIIGAGVALLAGLAWYLARLKDEDAAGGRVRSGPERLWPAPMLLTGAAAFMLGMLPAWVIYRQASQPSLYMDRYGLPAMFGVSLVWAALLDWLTPLRARKAVLVGVMVALAAGVHLQTADSYAQSWQEQVRVAWQLYWRAPAVQPETVFLADSGFFNYVYPSFMLNTLYHNPPTPDQGLHNFFYTNEVPLDPQAWRDGYKIDYIFRNFHFTESGLNSLVLYYQPGGAATCLWVLRPDDRDDPLIPETLRSALKLANLERIGPRPSSDQYPAREIFGREPAHQWCYFYEKAELARQQGDWAAIVTLEQQANQQGFTPAASRSNAPHEWIPFILADGYTGRWQQALTNTLDSARVQPRYQPVLCRVWQELAQQAPAGPERDSAHRQVVDQLGCAAGGSQ